MGNQLEGYSTINQILFNIEKSRTNINIFDNFGCVKNLFSDKKLKYCLTWLNERTASGELSVTQVEETDGGHGAI